MIETERRFFVRHDWLDYSPCAEDVIKIEQGYLGELMGLQIRVRIANDDAYLTLKGKKVAGSGLEIEKQISIEEAEALMARCESRIIEKTRFIVNYGGHKFEVDQFHGRHGNLLIAEVELESIDEDVDLPPWIGEEITSRDEYSNFALAVSNEY